MYQHIIITTILFTRTMGNKVNMVPTIEAICKAAYDNLDQIRAHLVRANKQSHKYVDKFQENVCDILKNFYKNEYKWIKEEKGEIGKFSIDIYGQVEGKKHCIIEIDATRIDQIAQKFLSRFALWGLNKKQQLLYVALLYLGPPAHRQIEDCWKYLRFCDEITKSRNKKSSVVGIYTDGYDIEVWKFDRTTFRIKFPDKETETKETMSMRDCAKEVIDFYIKNKNVGNSHDIEKAFSQTVTTKADPLKNEIKTSKGNMYISEDWDKWYEFIDCCKKKKIIIEKEVIKYQPNKPKEPFIYGVRASKCQINKRDVYAVFYFKCKPQFPKSEEKMQIWADYVVEHYCYFMFPELTPIVNAEKGIVKIGFPKEIIKKSKVLWKVMNALIKYTGADECTIIMNVDDNVNDKGRIFTCKKDELTKKGWQGKCDELKKILNDIEMSHLMPVPEDW